MSRTVPRTTRAHRRLWVACFVALCLQGSSCAPLDPAPGQPEYRRLANVETAGGIVDAAGGNLFVERSDLAIDTVLGTLTIGATWNSADAEWLWSFDVSYDGVDFRDASGAVHSVTGLGSGAAIPGTTWVVVSATELETKGGWLHTFDANGKLESVRWTSSSYPRLSYLYSPIAGEDRVAAIDACTTTACTNAYTISRDAAGRVTSISDRAGR